MSSFTSATACIWSGVSSYGKASSTSRCQGVSGAKACPAAAALARWTSTTCSARTEASRRTRLRVAAQSPPPIRLTLGDSPPVYFRTAAS